MSATAIVPVKRFAAAKQRLIGALEPERREELAGAMLADVLAALGRATELERVLVVTGEPAAADAAHAAGAEVTEDAEDSGHSRAALLGVARAQDADAELCALLPGDCPLLDAGELDAAIARSARGRVAVIPDRHGTGTNGLLLAPPDAIEPAFGEGSRDRHLGLAREAGWEAVLEPLPSLALDVDGPGDLAELRRVLDAAPERAPQTAEALR